jgi:hypothetical protein
MIFVCHLAFGVWKVVSTNMSLARLYCNKRQSDRLPDITASFARTLTNCRAGLTTERLNPYPNHAQGLKGWVPSKSQDLKIGPELFKGLDSLMSRG